MGHTVTSLCINWLRAPPYAQGKGPRSTRSRQSFDKRHLMLAEWNKSGRSKWGGLLDLAGFDALHAKDELQRPHRGVDEHRFGPTR